MECILCHKQSMRAVRRVKLRGKFNPTKVYHQQPNLQWVHLSVEQLAKYKLPLTPSAKKRIKACAKCIKKLYRA